MPLDFTGYVPGIPNMGPKYVPPTTIQLIEALQVEIKAIKRIIEGLAPETEVAALTETVNALDGQLDTLTTVTIPAIQSDLSDKEDAANSTSTNANRAVCQDPIDPFGPIVYYGTTAAVNQGSRPAVASLWQQYQVTLGYSFAKGSALQMTAWKPVYLKCAPQSDGSAIIDSTEPWVQALPSTNDGKIYIFLGVAYSETAIELNIAHPVYYHDGTAIRIWTGPVTP